MILKMRLYEIIIQTSKGKTPQKFETLGNHVVILKIEKSLSFFEKENAHSLNEEYQGNK